jgi:hypothetical protein
MPEMNGHLLKTLKYNYGTQSWFVETNAEQAEQTNAQLREWAERNEQILLEERDRITLLEIELSSLRAFTGRVKWLYQIFLRLNRGA